MKRIDEPLNPGRFKLLIAKSVAALGHSSTYEAERRLQEQRLCHLTSVTLTLQCSSFGCGVHCISLKSCDGPSTGLNDRVQTSFLFDLEWGRHLQATY
jgi:hypothetical protein